MIGPHKRAGRRRRIGKALVIGTLALAVVLVSSWTEAPRRTGREEMSISALAYLCNLATASPGAADDIQRQYPELTPREMESLRRLEQLYPGSTVALLARYQSYAEQMEGGS